MMMPAPLVSLVQILGMMLWMSPFWAWSDCHAVDVVLGCTGVGYAVKSLADLISHKQEALEQRALKASEMTPMVGGPSTMSQNDFYQEFMYWWV